MAKPLCDELAFVSAAVLHSPAWWQDDRKNWCAYCGIPMRTKGLKAGEQPPSARTRDHVIPLGLKGGHLTVPCCRACNVAKKDMSLQAFLLTPYFEMVRRKKHRHKWPVRDLLLASAAAAIRAAKHYAPPPAGQAAKLPQAGVKFSATPLMQ